MVHFVERNFRIAKNLEENIKSLEAENNCKIFKMEILKFSKEFKNMDYDLILADPPFFKDDIYEVVGNLFANRYLKQKGIVIIERSVITKEKDRSFFSVEPFKIVGDACLYEIHN